MNEEGYRNVPLFFFANSLYLTWVVLVCIIHKVCTNHEAYLGFQGVTPNFTPFDYHKIKQDKSKMGKKFWISCKMRGNKA